MMKIDLKWSLLFLSVAVILSMISDSSSSSWFHPTINNNNTFEDSFPVNPSFQLEFDYYRRSCPQAEKIVRYMIREFYESKPSIAPALIRLLFHDCFIQGCDASVLLNSIDGVQAEKEANPNQSLKGFDVIDTIKSKIESVCPRIVSCSDILVLSARESVVLSGGPFYPLYTGRRDGIISISQIASSQLPAPTDSLSLTLLKFFTRGFNDRETVNLLGGHSIGVIHCEFFKDRLFNFSGSGKPDPSIETSFLYIMRKRCNNSDSSSEDPAMNMEIEGAPELGFGKHYYRSLEQRKGILQADQQLMSNERTASWVRAYAKDIFMFRKDFSITMMKLSNLNALTGFIGEIRHNCSSRLIDTPEN